MKRPETRIEPTRRLCTQEPDKLLHQYTSAVATDIRATFRRLPPQQQRRTVKSLKG